MRAFDVRTGKLLWTFNTIPRPGEFGNDTWENESWAENGNVGVWTQITVDEELGLVYLPVETPTSDLLRRPSARQQPLRRKPRLRRSEDRPAQVALPVRAPSALELRHVVGGDPRGHHRQRQANQGRRRSRQAGIPVRLRSRDRDSRCGRSKSVRCRRATFLARRRARRSRSRPSRRPTRTTMLTLPDDLIDFTPELRAQAIEQMKRYKVAHVDVQPADARRRERACSARSTWAMRSAAPTGPASPTIPKRTRCTPRPTTSNITATSLVTPPKGFSDIRYVSGVAGPRVPRGARTRRLLRGRLTACDGADRSARARSPASRVGPPISSRRGRGGAAPGGAAAGAGSRALSAD